MELPADLRPPTQLITRQDTVKTEVKDEAKDEDFGNGSAGYLLHQDHGDE